MALILCYAATAGFGVLGCLALYRVVPVDAAVWLFLATIVLALIGVRVQVDLRSASHLLAHRQSQIEILQGELQEQRNAVDAMADGLEIAIFICDEHANILYANRRAIELFRFERPIGRTILAVTLSHDLEQLVLEAIFNRQSKSAEIAFPYPDDRVGNARVWPTDANSERAFVSVYEITDLRRLERIRQDFVANVSHELRTPLTIIRSMAETLVDDEPEASERTSKYLNKIIGEVDRLSLISRDLLILSAAESNPVRKQTCDLASVFRSAVKELKPKAAEKGLSLRFQGPRRFTVGANPSQMTQVAQNLVDNAIKYTTTGKIRVELQADAKSVRVSVADTGIGIPSDQISRIFERFYRVDRARSRATGGTGLGLSIVKHIVEAHGGKVTVYSALNRGSTFTVEIPIGG